MGETVHHT